MNTTETKDCFGTTLVPRPSVYILKYRTTGKRGTKWGRRKVASVQEAVDWMNSQTDAFLPAFVLTNAWRPETVAILN